jgi:hypothetical protein
MGRLTEWRNGHAAIVNHRENYIDKLARYEDAEEHGRLIVLPCKIGDTVYYIKTLQNGADTKVIEQDTVKRIIFDGIDNQIVISYSHSFMMSDFNRLLFLSREEAEKALEWMKCLK